MQNQTGHALLKAAFTKADAAQWGVYGDWLEEQGFAGEAARMHAKRELLLLHGANKDSREECEALIPQVTAALHDFTADWANAEAALASAQIEAVQPEGGKFHLRTHLADPEGGWELQSCFGWGMELTLHLNQQRSMAWLDNVHAIDDLLVQGTALTQDTGEEVGGEPVYAPNPDLFNPEQDAQCLKELAKSSLLKRTARIHINSVAAQGEEWLAEFADCLGKVPYLQVLQLENMRQADIQGLMDRPELGKTVLVDPYCELHYSTFAKKLLRRNQRIATQERSTG